MGDQADSLTHNGLPALHRHGYRNSMRFSVESRIPFLILRLVELLLSQPESYLISVAGETKHVFRAAMRGIVPYGVLDRLDKMACHSRTTVAIGRGFYSMALVERRHRAAISRSSRDAAPG